MAASGRATTLPVLNNEVRGHVTFLERRDFRNIKEWIRSSFTWIIQFYVNKLENVFSQLCDTSIWKLTVKNIIGIKLIYTEL